MHLDTRALSPTKQGWTQELQGTLNADATVTFSSYPDLKVMLTAARPANAKEGCVFESWSCGSDLLFMALRVQGKWDSFYVRHAQGKGAGLALFPESVTGWEETFANNSIAFKAP